MLVALVYTVVCACFSLYIVLDMVIPYTQVACAMLVDNPATRNPKLLGFVFFCIFTILAPLVLIGFITGAGVDKFRDVLFTALTTDEKHTRYNNI